MLIGSRDHQVEYGEFLFWDYRLFQNHVNENFCDDFVTLARSRFVLLIDSSDQTSRLTILYGARLGPFRILNIILRSEIMLPEGFWNDFIAQARNLCTQVNNFALI